MFFSIKSSGNKREKIIVGINSARYVYSCVPISTHAEIDALQKLKSEYIRGKIKRMTMDLLVVRLSKTGMMSMSAPCQHCLKQLANAKYVNIKNVYYSKNKDEIVCERFDTLINSAEQFISSGYRFRMGKPRNLSEKDRFEREKITRRSKLKNTPLALT